MKQLRKGLVAVFIAAAFAAMLGGHSRAGVAQSQRAQVAVSILINVTGVAKSSVIAPQGPEAIALSENSPVLAAHIALRAKGSHRGVDSIFGNADSVLVAQQQAQSAVKVEAEVSPNPTATELYSNTPDVVMNGTAGTTVTQSCAYQVTVHTTISSWTLRDGLSQNPSSGSTSFPGPDIAHNDYVGSTPHPSASPFIVYPTAWANVATASDVQVYCVDLSVKIPSTTPTGAYSTNAVYTLYW